MVTNSVKHKKIIIMTIRVTKDTKIAIDYCFGFVLKCVEKFKTEKTFISYVA